MFDKDKTYHITVNTYQEEVELITLFQISNIYWVSKGHNSNYNIIQKLKTTNIQMFEPQYINISFNEDENYWIYLYVTDHQSSKSDIKFNATKLLRKHKLIKLNGEIH